MTGKQLDDLRATVSQQDLGMLGREAFMAIMDELDFLRAAKMEKPAQLAREHAALREIAQAVADGQLLDGGMILSIYKVGAEELRAKARALVAAHP